MFLERGISKSGKHAELRYKYFELDDIVPIAIEIFSEVGLLALVSFGEETACLNVVNTDNPSEVIPFSSPMRYPTENRMINPVQSLGSAQTYLRRYLYMMALDICEPDSIEPTTIGNSSENIAPPRPSQRAEIKKNLTDPNSTATETQIEALKRVLKALKDTRPEYEDTITHIAIKTKGFTNLSKTECELLIQQMSEVLESKQ